jgi:hypothetical protein
VQVATDDASQTVNDDTDAAIPNVANSFSSRTVLVDLRFKFVQSISQLTSVLDSQSDQPDTSSINASTLQSTKLDFRLSAYIQSQAHGETLQGYVVDTDA